MWPPLAVGGASSTLLRESLWIILFAHLDSSLFFCLFSDEEDHQTKKTGARNYERGNKCAQLTGNHCQCCDPPRCCYSQLSGCPCLHYNCLLLLRLTHIPGLLIWLAVCCVNYNWCAVNCWSAAVLFCCSCHYYSIPSRMLFLIGWLLGCL